MDLDLPIDLGLTELPKFKDRNIDFAWNDREYKKVLDLLKNGCDLPDQFDLKIIPDDHDLKKYFIKRSELNTHINNDDFDSIKKFIKDVTCKYYLNKDGESSLLTAIKSRKFEIYAFLKSKGIKFKDENEKIFINELDDNEKYKLKNCLNYYFPRLNDSHILYLVSKSRITIKMNTKDYNDYITSLYKKLDCIPEISVILKVIQYSFVDIIFDFTREDITDMDPNSNDSNYGSCLYKKGRIYIGAKNEECLAGTLAHELTHLAMQIVYQNDCCPYNKISEENKLEFLSIINEIKLNIDKNIKIDDIIKRVYESYDDSDRSSELIVRVPHILANYNKEKGAKILNDQAKNLLNFYRFKVIPDCEKFLEQWYKYSLNNDIKLLNQISGIVEELKESKIRFENILNFEQFLDNEKKKFKFLYTKSIFLSKVMVYQFLEKNSPQENYLFFKFDKFINQIYEICFIETLKFLVLEVNYNLTPDIEKLDELFEILKNKNNLKCFFLINMKDTTVIKDYFKKFEAYFDGDQIIDFTFSNLFDESKETFLNKEVLFQGYSLTLKELLIGHNFSEMIDSDILVYLFDNMPIKIGENLNKYNSEYYVKRFFEMKNKSKTYSEDGLIEYENKENQIIKVISDIAGTGKSTVLTRLCHNIKKNKPNLWVVLINLNNYTDILEKRLEKKGEFFNDNDALDFLVTDLLKLNDFESKFFRYSIETSGRVVIMLDSFDEICPNYEEIVINFIQYLVNKTKIKNIWLATRPHLNESFRNKFKIREFTLKTLTGDDQEQFLNYFWAKELQRNNLSNKFPSKELIKKFNNSIFDGHTKFTSIPLHLKMLAEIYIRNNNIESLQLNKFFPHFSLGHFYKLFVKEKLKNYFIEKKGLDFSKTCLDDNICIAIKEMNKKYELLALFNFNELKKLIDTKDKNKVEIIKDLIPDYEFVCGIDKNNKPKFIHSTFTEYFTASYIFKSITKYNNSKTIKFFIEKILIYSHYHGVRLFLNDFLNDTNLGDENLINIRKALENYFNVLKNKIKKRENPVIVAAEEKRVQILLFLSKIDSNIFKSLLKLKGYQGKSVLHFLCSNNLDSKEDFEILKLLIDNDADVNAKDEDLNSVLHYAIYNCDFKIIKFLVEKGAKVNDIDKKNSSILHEAVYFSEIETIQFLIGINKDNINDNIDNNGNSVLHNAVNRGNIDIIKCLVQNGADVNAKDNNLRSVLNVAIGKKEDVIIKYLLKEGANLNEENEIDEEMDQIIDKL